jgi:signal transduction histidine kinase
MAQDTATLKPTQNLSHKDRLSPLVHIVAIFVTASFFTVIVAWLIIDNYPSSLDLHFNFYALLSAAALVSNLAAFTLIVRLKLRTDTIIWFSIFLLSVAAWAAPAMMQNLSATSAGAAFWGPITTIGSVFMPVALYMFALAYTNPKHLTSPFVFPFMAGVSALTVYTDSHTDLMHNYAAGSMLSSPWGFVAKTGPEFFIISLWLIVLCAGSIVLLAKFREKTADPILRKQARLFIIAIALPLSIGTITDGLMPALDINLLPPLAIPLLTVTGLIICYGILKQGFFSFTPALIAEDVLSTINEAVIGVTPDLHLSYANQGTERLLGRSSGELTNISLRDILAEPWTIEQIKQKIFQPLGHEELYTIDSVRFMTVDGDPITTKVSITKVSTGNQSYGHLLVLTDISDLARNKELVEKQVVERTKQLHDEQAKLRSSIEGLNLGFLLINVGGVIALKNKAINNIFGLSETAEVTTKQLEELLFDVNFEKISQQFWKGQSVTLDKVVMGAKILKIFIGPVIVDQGDDQKRTIGTVVTVEDITEATVQERSKDEFFSIASHELRTPLTSIKGNASLILDFYKEPLKDPQLKEMVDDIHTSSVRLIEIVNDFLDVSRLEQGKMSFKYAPISVEKIIESVAYEMKAVLDEKKLYLKVDKLTTNSLPEVWADEDRLKQIIYNLVGNASKFTEEGGITINSSINGKFVRVAVSDTGRGMTPESQLLLFHKFQQASSSLLTRDTTKGTGLGLYISKMMTENMGGTISLDSSEVNKGTTFSFTLPIATEEQKTTTLQPKTTTDSSSGLTINNAVL